MYNNSEWVATCPVLRASKLMLATHMAPKAVSSATMSQTPNFTIQQALLSLAFYY